MIAERGGKGRIERLTRKHENTNRSDLRIEQNSAHREGWSVEVHEKAEAATSSSEVGAHLCEVHRGQCLHRLQLHDNLIGDEEVEPKLRDDPPFKEDMAPVV